MFTTGLSSDPNSLSGNLLDAMAKHTRAAINDTLRVTCAVKWPRGKRFGTDKTGGAHSASSGQVSSGHVDPAKVVVTTS